MDSLGYLMLNFFLLKILKDIWNSKVCGEWKVFV